MGLGGEIGSLEGGKRADVTVFDLHRFNTQPTRAPIKDLLYYGDAGNVRMVIVDGEVVFEQGRFVRVDAERVLDELRRASDRLRTRIAALANGG